MFVWPISYAGTFASFGFRRFPDEIPIPISNQTKMVLAGKVSEENSAAILYNV